MNYKEMFEDNNIVVVKEYNSGYDEFREPFTVVTSGGVMKQGELTPALYADIQRAEHEFETTFLWWLKGRRKIHLRIPPELEIRKFWVDSIRAEWSSQTYYFVYCRLTAY